MSCSAATSGARSDCSGIGTGRPVDFGALANHIWSFAGDDDRNDINATYLQPFLS